MIKSLSIVFPLYNEAQRLFYTIEDIGRFSKKKNNKKYRIYIRR